MGLPKLDVWFAEPEDDLPSFSFAISLGFISSLGGILTIAEIVSHSRLADEFASMSSRASCMATGLAEIKTRWDSGDESISIFVQSPVGRSVC